ncbi:hypothetical protein [Thalassiella azotivora]
MGRDGSGEDGSAALAVGSAGAGEEVRDLARRVRVLAEDVADAATRARATQGVDWRSVAADAFRGELAQRVQHLEACHLALLDAAGELARHAAGVDERVAALRAAAQVTGDVLADAARDAVSGEGRGLGVRGVAVRGGGS